MKLLLIDDDQLDRMAIIRTLRSSGRETIDVVEADTARAGLKLFTEGEFDAVLLDLRLPDMDGLDVLRIMQLHGQKHVTVIVISGIDDEEIERQCILNGAQDFLLKGEVTPRHLSRALLHARTRQSIEQKLHESNERLRLMAETDALTGLANRYSLEESMRNGIARADRLDIEIALLLLDLDDFKLINDSLGHDIGDQVLKEIATRLKNITHDGDIACRLGGDEFAILTYCSSDDVAVKSSRIAEEIIKAVSVTPFIIGKHEISIACSVGIATHSACAGNTEDLLKSADIAMYSAKRDGKSRFHFFSTTLQQQLQRRISIEQDLRRAIDHGELILYFQPKVDATSYAIQSAEALIRWRHPRLGVLAPGAFLDVAEACNLLPDLDRWVRRAACQQLAAWKKQALLPPDFSLAINTSAQLLLTENFAEEFKHDLAMAGLAGHEIELEVTEGALIANLTQGTSILSKIRTLDVSVAIDDFGTGYSSLAYLKHLPATTLKIDQAFLRDVPEQADACRVLRAMIVMGNSLGLTLVIEGVETAQQALICREYGAEVLQGYFFAKPLPAEAFIQQLNQRSSA